MISKIAHLDVFAKGTVSEKVVSMLFSNADKVFVTGMMKIDSKRFFCSNFNNKDKLFMVELKL